MLLFILEAVIKNKRHHDIQMQRSNNYHLLTALTATNIIFSTVFSPSNTRLQRQPRPKTEGFWIDVFPYLVDGEGYNSFRRHFRITLTTFRTIVTRLKPTKLLPQTPLIQHLYGNKLPLYYGD